MYFRWLVSILLVGVTGAAVAQNDPWDPDNSAPPYRTPPLAEQPWIYDGTLGIDVTTDSLSGKPILHILYDPDATVPVTYSVRSDDTMVTVTISVLPPGKRVWPQSDYNPPDSDFVIRVIYTDSPDEAALFRAIRDSTAWTVAVIRETGFARKAP